MKLSESFFYTLREDSKDEESLSGNLLVKSGMIKKVTSGVYSKLPLGQKVYNNIVDVIKKHMNLAGAQQVTMPLLLPIDVFKKSNRYELFGPGIFTLNDRYNRAYALGPTHEEFFTLTAMMKSKSYKDFPYCLYQIGNKYRDEVRPRLGLIRTREFTMKDAYSFDINQEMCDIAYEKQKTAYKNIFDELKINYRIVKADTGVMGGLLSEEFQAITEVGEDIIVMCDNCDLSSNIEVCPCHFEKVENNEKPLKIEKIFTPNAGTIEEVSNFLGKSSEDFVKTLIYKIDDKFYALLVEGDREVNEIKVQKLLNATEVGLADAVDVERITKARVGFAGPVGLDIPIIMDNAILNKKNFIVGANESDYHYKNVNLSDFSYSVVADISNIKEGDKCPFCGGKINFSKGIEVGNIFKLGAKYSNSLGLNYLDENNNLKPVIMACYGLGVERTMAAIVEQHHDDKGIIWPINIAPYKVAIVPINDKDEKQMQTANELYDALTKLNIDTILDDRKERAGIKFNDMDLIGIPIRIVIGKKINENLVEFKMRNEEITYDIPLNEIVDKIKTIIKG